MKKIFLAFLLILLSFSEVFALTSTKDYADYLAKTVDDVVKTIHATHPDSYLTHLDVLTIMCVEQRGLAIGQDSHAGAKGLTQVMPNTFDLYVKQNILGFADFAKKTNCTAAKLSSDVRCSIEAGARIFDHLLTMFNGDRTRAAWGYNAGPGAVKKGKLPSETRNYIYKAFPYCQNAILNGQSPAKSGAAREIWSELIAKSKEFAHNGFFDPKAIVGKFVPYIVGQQGFDVVNFDQEESIWDRFWKKLFGDSSSSDSGTSYGRNNSSLNSPKDSLKDNSQSNILSGSQFFGNSSGSTNNNNSNAESLDSENVLSQSSKFVAKVMFACLPEVLEKNEPYILAYLCPEGYTAQLNGIALKENSSVSIKYADKSAEYRFTCAKSDKVFEKSCNIKVINPKILDFRVLYSDLSIGSKVHVLWSAKDFETCKVSNLYGTLTKSALLGDEYFTIEQLPDRVSLSCAAANGKTIKKEIDIINK